VIDACPPVRSVVVTNRGEQRYLRFQRGTFTIRHVQNSFPQLLLSFAMLPAVAVACVGGATRAQTSSEATKIGSIRVSGQRRFSAEQVIAATGVKLGQVFTARDLDVAAERLGKSGAFQEVKYSYVPQGGQISVEFKVVEAPKFRECVFDNFVWLTKDEIQAGLKKDVPLYIGVAPETGDLLDEIARALEKLSQARGITVQVTRNIEQPRIGDPNWSHLYAAEGASVKVQSLRFTGNLTLNPNDLQKEAARLIGRDYSEFQSSLFGSKTIVPFYQERGYLQAKVDTPAAVVLSHAEGSNEFAVEVVYPVTEGNVYRWTPAEWSGNQVMAAAALEATTGMKTNDVANAKKIDEGWEAVKKIYSKNGYIEAALLPEPVFEEESRRVHYRVSMKEGPQYHMGNFEVIGASQAAADRLKNSWRLKAGAIFDASYPGEFLQKDVRSALPGMTLRSAKFKIMMSPNRALHVMDVTLQVQ
jgi:outer membrane protein assembly factor BamA